MTTAIAYSFMNMDSKRSIDQNDNGAPRRSSTNTDKRYSNDNSSETGHSRGRGSGKRRPRKRSSSGSRAKKDTSVKVEIVVQFFKVGEIDTLKEHFYADVIIKAKWREPTFDGQLSINESVDFSRLWNPKLYIENSLGDPKEQIRHSLIFNEKGEAFICEKRISKGTFMENLELDDFPFDVQDLTITVASELPCSECDLIEDKEEHHVVNRQSFVDEQEWHLYVHTECTKKELVIDQVDNSVKRSALSVKCRAARRPGYFVWNIFMITFLICSLAFATFSVEKELPENRLQLSFTLVLTSVAFKSVVNSSLPRISYLTYMDKYLLVSMVMLYAVCTWHALVTRLVDKDAAMADRVENIVLTILGVLYVLYNIGFIFIIYLFPCKKRRVMSQKDKEYKKSRRESLILKGSINLLTNSYKKQAGFPQQNSGCKIQTKTPAPSNRTTGTTDSSRHNGNNSIQVLTVPDVEYKTDPSRGFPPLVTSYSHFMTSSTTTETKARDSPPTLPPLQEEVWMNDIAGRMSRIHDQKYSLPALPVLASAKLLNNVENRRMRKRSTVSESEFEDALQELTSD